jgi:vacuolar-type H+-ATPase subunit H
MAKIESTVELLDKLSANLKTVRSDIVAAQAELDRIKGLGDKLLQSARREAQNEAGAMTEKAVADARTQTKTLLDNARQQADEIVRTAHAAASKIISDGEQRLKDTAASALLDRAQAIVKKAFAA